MCERYTIEQALAVIRDRRDALQWQRRQLNDELRDLRACPEDAVYIPEVKAEKSEVCHRINELDYLLNHLIEDIDEMLFMQELDDKVYA